MSDTATAANNNEVTVKSRRGRRALSLVLIVLILLLGLATYLLFRLMTPPGGAVTGDDAAGITWVRSIYGTGEGINQQFDRTTSAVPDADGNIWVTDAINQSLMGFTPDGRYIRSISGTEEMPMYVPSRSAVGPDGRYYVCETQLDVVRVLDADGNDAGSFAIPKPVSIAVSEDRIVVGAIMGFAILDLEGNPIKVIGERGQGENQFDYVHGVAIAENGNIYVVDSFNNRLSAYDPDGERLWMVRMGSPTNQAEMEEGRLSVKELDAEASGEETLTVSDAQLQLPLGLTIDGAGRLVTVDMFECTLAAFDPEDGSFIGRYGDVGAQDGQFFYPQSISYDRQRDWFIVSDSLNNRVQIVRIAGSSAGGDAAAAVRRALDGPLRACLFPLLLLLIALTVWLVSRARRKRREAAVAAGAPAAVAEVGEGSADG